MTYLLAKGFNLFDASQLFRLLDEESNGRVDLPTFIYIMLRLTGEAKSTDVIMVLHETRRQAKLLHVLLQQSQEQLEDKSTSTALTHGGSTKSMKPMKTSNKFRS